MVHVILPLAIAVMLCSLTSCQSKPEQEKVAAETPATTAAGASTEKGARAAVATYIGQQPNAALYQLDSARVMDVSTHWQVLVPRSDWAQRMPNAAAFEVDKQSGKVTMLRIK